MRGRTNVRVGAESSVVGSSMSPQGPKTHVDGGGGARFAGALGRRNREGALRLRVGDCQVLLAVREVLRIAVRERIEGPSEEELAVLPTPIVITICGECHGQL